MPRKRKTRQPTREKPTLPDGDEGTNLTPEEKQNKLDLVLSDFDAQVKKRVDDMRREADKLCKAIMQRYRIELMKMPKELKEMKHKDFIAHRGVDMQPIDDLVDSLAATIATTRQNPRHGKHLTPVEEENSENSTVKQKQLKKNGTRGRKRSPLKAQLPLNAQAVRRSTRRAAAKYTPASKLKMIEWGATPIVTPKFDPRLPVTPAVGLRNPKPKEPTVCIKMSANGSPLNMSQQTEILVPVDGASKAIQITDDLDIDGLDDATRKTLLQLTEKLSIIFSKPAV